MRLRNREEIFLHTLKRGYCEPGIPEGMPSGPFNTFQALFEAISKWSQQSRGFAVKKDTLLKALVSRGERRLILCHKARNRSKHGDRATMERPNQKNKCTNCPWGVYCEESTAGWIPTNMRGSGGVVTEHNHEVAQNLMELRAIEPSLRCVPEYLNEEARVLEKKGDPASAIFTFLSKRCREEKTEITFTLQDIQNTFSPDSNIGCLDCTNLVTHLSERKEADLDLHWNTSQKPDGSLKNAFFTMSGAVDVWSQSQAKVVVLDTKHGSNKYGYYVAVFSTVRNDGRTCVLAGGLIENQDEVSFTWLANEFSKGFCSPPNVIFTDGDEAMANAIRNHWTTTIHLLCTFHLYKNFYKHIKPLLSHENFKKAAQMWWRLCKHTDISLKFHFAEKWTDLYCFIQTNATSAESFEDKASWLMRMGASCTKWAGCFTWGISSYGCHSTQRAEAIHSSMALFCSKTSTILDLVLNLEQMADNQVMKSEHNAVRNRLNTSASAVSESEVRNSIVWLSNQCVPFAKHLILTQASMVTKYNISPLSLSSSDGSSPFSSAEVMVKYSDDMNEVIFHSENELRGVSRNEVRAADFGTLVLEKEHKTSLEFCSCQYGKNWALPCRHQFAMISFFFMCGYSCSDSDIVQFLLKNIDAFWLKDLVLDCIPRNMTFHNPIAHLVSTPIRTKQQRRDLIMGAIKPLADHLSNSDSGTDSFLKYIKGMINKKVVKDSGIQIPGILVGNPEVKGKKQTQKRGQPSNCGPTHKNYAKVQNLARKAKNATKNAKIEAKRNF